MGHTCICVEPHICDAFLLELIIPRVTARNIRVTLRLYYPDTLVLFILPGRPRYCEMSHEELIIYILRYYEVLRYYEI